MAPDEDQTRDADSEGDVADLIDTAVSSMGIDAAVVRVRGEVDSFTASFMEQAINQAFDLSTRRLLIDLDGVEFFGTGGIAVLVQARTQALGKQVTLGLVCSTRLVLRPLELAGLIELFAVTASVEAALGPS